MKIDDEWIDTESLLRAMLRAKAGVERFYSGYGTVINEDDLLDLIKVLKFMNRLGDYPYRWIVLDSKGSPILSLPHEEQAREYMARGYTVFPTYKESNDDLQNTNSSGEAGS